MALSIQPYKGARDFYPPDKRLQKYIFAIWRRVCERFGYEEYDAPILESLDLYLAKTGEEIVKEQTYSFEDRGGRKLAIRPEMTPTVSRMVAARRQQLAYPVRWYSIPNLWRYERPQRGRLREHWQLNVDIFGVGDSAAEYEIITLVDSVFKEFGASNDMYDIRLNSRKLIDEVLGAYLELSPQESHSVVKLIDRMQKMERAEFIAKLDAVLPAAARQDDAAEKLLAVLEAQEIGDLPGALSSHPSSRELAQILNILKTAGVQNARFDPSVMRGFDYYTDVVFEVFDRHPDNNRSMLGGGRYDGLVGLFGVEPVATVGFGWGDVTLMNFLELHHLLPDLRSETDVYVVLAGKVLEGAQQIVAELRGEGLNVAVDLSGKKLGDQLKHADKKALQYVLILGEEELARGDLKLKDLTNGHETTAPLPEVVKILQQAKASRAGH